MSLTFLGFQPGVIYVLMRASMGEVHKRIITDYFKQYMMKASQEEDCPYYLSRASIIELLGLDPDPAVRETKKGNAEEGDTFPCHLLSWASSQE